MRARMPDHDRIGDASRDGALAPPVARAVAALRAEVPVRAAWRAGVLAGIENTARDERMAAFASDAGPGPRRARLVVTWPVAAAAALLIFAAGALAARMAGARVEGPPPARADALHGGARAPARGTTRFVLVAPNARQVALVGDFNLWNPASAPMRRVSGTAEWEIDLALPAGRHVYAFVVDGDVTADPSAPRTAGDDFGRPNSVVLVSSPRS